MAVPIYLQTNSVRGFPFLHNVSRLFNDGHSNQCQVVPHCSFDWHFSNYYIFSYACWASCISSWEKCLFRSSAHPSIELFVCLLLLLSFMCCLYILEIKPLLVDSFADIFSYSIGSLFILFIVSSAVLKLVSLIRSYLFIFAFICIDLGEWPNKILVWFISENVLSMLTSRSYMMSCLIFKSLAVLSLFLHIVQGYVLTSLIIWSLGGFCLLLCSFPSGLLWQFFYGSI